MGCNGDYCEIYPKKRDLDGAYFKVDRNGEEMELCFSDMTETERGKVLAGKSILYLIEMVGHLADCLHALGDALDITSQR